MELWGGIECTINRVGEEYFDQLDFSGHYSREGDNEKFISLGIKRIRYPILWERHQPSSEICINWDGTAERLEPFKNAGVQIIAGLVHHGSGPRFVNILEESFVHGLAAYAKQVALRFPWIAHYTPVNEPLTTARFCGLYGLWFPHEKSDRAFLRILVNECRATILAMSAIREINPCAKLVQTEDIGKVHSTPALNYQSDFENARRWLSLDLLNGKVDSSHELYRYLLSNGISQAELEDIRRSCICPDILGANYYVTSERYLDENYAIYPESTHGGNGLHRYADIEAVRTAAVKPDGPGQVFRELWMRYKVTVAITEVHLHCGREDQLRWLKYIWDSAEKLKKGGVDIIAVTLWSLLGSHGWDSLLTGTFDHYESGVYDVRAGDCRPTAIAQMARQLADGSREFHPVLAEAGWWDTPARIIYGQKPFFCSSVSTTSTSLLVLGSDFSLGRAFVETCEKRNIAVQGINTGDILHPSHLLLTGILRDGGPWAVVNAMGCQNDFHNKCGFTGSHYDHSSFEKELAAFCNTTGTHCLTFSADEALNQIHLNTGHTSGANLFSVSGLPSSDFSAQIYPCMLIVCTKAKPKNLCYPEGLKDMLALDENAHYPLGSEDIALSAISLSGLAAACIDLLIDGEKGVWNLSGKGELVHYGFPIALSC